MERVENSIFMRYLIIVGLFRAIQKKKKKLISPTEWAISSKPPPFDQ
jgi:hypothetical protein